MKTNKTKKAIQKYKKCLHLIKKTDSNLLKILSNKNLIFIFFIVLVFVLKFNTINLPLYWDSINIQWVIHQFLELNLQLKVIPEGMHPPLLSYIFAVFSKIFSFNIIIFHSIIFIISAFGLYYMYLISYKIFKDKTIAFCSSLTLFFLPLYFSFSGRVYYPIPLTTLTIICFYYLLKNRYFLFSFFCTLGVLVKETFILIIPAAFIWILLNKKFNKIKNIIYFVLPLIILTIWEVLLIINYSNSVFLAFKGRSLITFGISKDLIISWLSYLYITLIDNFNFILTVPIMIYLLFKKNIAKKENVTFIVFIGSYFFFFIFADKFVRYVLPIYPLLIILFYKSIIFCFKFFKHLFSFMKPIDETRLSDIPCLLKSKFRILNNCPFNISIKKVVIFITLITIILFSTSYYKESGDTRAFVIEKNMEYLDSLKTQKMAIDFIEENYKNHTVLAIWPITQMTDYYPSYPKRKFKVKSFAGDENITNFDVIIQSSQIPSFYEPKLSKFINKGLFSKDLKLVKRFKIKNKYTEIYENIK